MNIQQPTQAQILQTEENTAKQDAQRQALAAKAGAMQYIATTASNLYCRRLQEDILTKSKCKHVAKECRLAAISLAMEMGIWPEPEEWDEMWRQIT